MAVSSVFAQQQPENSQNPLDKISLIFDYDLNFRAASYSNVDYTSPKAVGDSIFSQYLSLNIIGKFEDRIEMSGKLASYGLSGKENPVFMMPYKEDDFSLFLETAFLTFKSAQNSVIPYKLYGGKQEFTAGDGLIVDGNNNGMLGFRGTADFFKNFTLDAFAAKADNYDFSVYGGSLKIKMAPVIEIGIYQERNNTGFEYEKGVLADTSTQTIRYDNKTFYDLRITGGNKKYKYRLEGAQQKGELVRSTATAENTEYDAYAFVLEGSWSGTILKAQSNAKLMFSYADAKGDNAFNPTLARRYNGLQRIGYGTLFAANSADSFFILPDEYGGINTLGAQFDVSPWNFLQTGIGFFLFSATDAPPDAGNPGFAEIYGAKADLGNEFDFFVKYSYKHYFDAGLSIAVYTPPSGDKSGFANNDSSYLFQLEVSSKF